MYVLSSVYVRPIIWFPCLRKDIELLEKVQRRFTKRLHGLKHLKYGVRLARLGLPSLELRRLHLDLLYCYKIIFGLICLDVNKYFTFTSLPTKGHPYKLYKAQCGNVKWRNFFTERIVNVWNSLPANVDFSSLPRFKKSIIQVDLAQFLKCNVQWIFPLVNFDHFISLLVHVYFSFLCVCF